MGDQWVMVGSGVYLADAPKAKPAEDKISASELTELVRDGADVLEKKGETAYPEFRKKGSRWFHDDTYFFVWDMNGKRVFHAANPEGEGKNVRDLKDIKGRPIGKMILDTGKSADGEGWIHYMYPEPGDIFPTWKSTFVKRVTFPSGKKYILGCGIYNMEMNKSFIEDVVDRAAKLVSETGRDSFNRLRDKTGPFVFMDTYVFVIAPDGTELVNPAQPSLEGRNLMDMKDLKGNQVVREEVNAAMEHGSAWLDMYWFKPGENTPALKRTYVKKVLSGDNIFIVGSGFYPDR
jgi:signal transduction histidine kinase